MSIAGDLNEAGVHCNSSYNAMREKDGILRDRAIEKLRWIGPYLSNGRFISCCLYKPAPDQFHGRVLRGQASTRGFPSEPIHISSVMYSKDIVII